MTHDKVYEQFKKLLPIYAKHIIEWFPNGLNSIRVRRSDNQDFIFSIHPDGMGVCYETKDSFIERIKGGGVVMKC